MALQTESERRFLLKNRPSGVDFTQDYSIFQYYTADKVRFRAQRLLNAPYNETRFFRTTKTPIEAGVNLEEEWEVELSDFVKAMPDFRRYIRKNRLVVATDNGRKWEIDRFWSCTLVIAEIELPTLQTDLILPEYIESELIVEVTGIPDFSNYQLSEPYNPEEPHKIWLSEAMQKK